MKQKGKYAEGTNVSSEQSRMEIERTLKRYGADQFMYGTTADKAVIAFKAHSRNIRFALPLPPLSEFKVGKGSWGHPVENDKDKALQLQEQSHKQRWRALALCIKAKLEAVEAGITQFEEEFYAHIVLPGGRTIYEETADNVRVAYESGKMPPLLPHLGD